MEVDYKKEFNKLINNKTITIKALRRCRDDKKVGLGVQWEDLYKIAMYFYELGQKNSPRS